VHEIEQWCRSKKYTFQRFFERLLDYPCLNMFCRDCSISNQVDNRCCFILFQWQYIWLRLFQNISKQKLFPSIDSKYTLANKQVEGHSDFW